MAASDVSAFELMEPSRSSFGSSSLLPIEANVTSVELSAPTTGILIWTTDGSASDLGRGPRDISIFVPPGLVVSATERELARLSQGPILKSIEKEMARFTSEAIAVGEVGISEKAAASVRDWVQKLISHPRFNHDKMSVNASGMADGGSLILLTNPKLTRQITLRFSRTGELGNCTKVSPLTARLLNASDVELGKVFSWFGL